MDCCIFPVSIQHNIEALRVDLLCSPGSLSIRGTGSHVSTSFSILAVAYTSGLLALWWTCHRASSLHPNACLKSWPTLSSVSNVCLLLHLFLMAFLHNHRPYMGIRNLAMNPSVWGSHFRKQCSCLNATESTASPGPSSFTQIESPMMSLGFLPASFCKLPPFPPEVKQSQGRAHVLSF